MDVDYIIGHPNKDVHATDLAEVPIIRMYGVTEAGVPALFAFMAHVSSSEGCISCSELLISGTV